MSNLDTAPGAPQRDPASDPDRRSKDRPFKGRPGLAGTADQVAAEAVLQGHQLPPQAITSHVQQAMQVMVGEAQQDESDQADGIDVRATLKARLDEFTGPMPGADDPEGVAIWIEQRLQMTRELVKRETRTALTRDAVTTTRTPPRFITLRETADMETTDDDYVIGDGLLTRGGKMAIYAKAGCGKTTFLDYVGASLASGQPLLGVHPVDRPHRVLFVQGELAEPEIASHGQDLLDVYENTPAIDSLVFWRNTQLGLPGGEADLRAAIAEGRFSILMLDPFNRFFRGDNSMTQEQVGEVFRMLDRLLEDTTLGLEAVVVSHHANVSGARMVGTYDFEGWPSTIIRLESVLGIPDQRKMTYEKIRAPRSSYLGQTKSIVLGDQGYLYLDGQHVDEPFAGPFLVVQALIEAAGQATRADLVARTMAKAHCQKRAAGGYLRDAVKQGRIEKAGMVGKEAVYRIVATADQDEDAA